jgi:hypothetical protein
MTQTLDIIASDLQTFVTAPIAAFGLAGFLFDVAGEASAHLQAEITDHYTEDNRALQDHIARKPKRVTLRGYVGEVVHNTNGNGGFTEKVPQKLTEFSDYLPQLSAAATQAQALLDGATKPMFETVIKDGSNIYALTKNLLNSTDNNARQQNAYNYFKALYNQGILQSIQTPWEYMTSMAIESISIIQGDESVSVSEFAITYKEVRVAETKTLHLIDGIFDKDALDRISFLGKKVFDGPCSIQKAVTNNIGNISGEPLPYSQDAPIERGVITVTDTFKENVSGVWRHNY